MWHDSDHRLAKAVQRFEEGDLSAARAMLRGLDRRGVISPRIDLYLGHCHLEDDQLPAALRRYRRSASLSPRDPAPWMGLGLCYGRLGRLDRSVRAFRAALARDEELEEAHCNLTHCYALLGDLRAALRHARKAQRLDPTCPHVHRHLALGFLLADRPERALEAWARVLRLAPEHPEASVGRGRALLALGRRREAREAFHRALRGPFASDAAFGLGDLARHEGRLAEAVAHYRSAVRREPGFEEARTCWAEALLDTGQARRAREVLAPLLTPSAAPADDAAARLRAEAPGPAASGSPREPAEGAPRPDAPLLLSGSESGHQAIAPSAVAPAAVRLAARIEREDGRRALGLRYLRRFLVEGAPVRTVLLAEHLLACDRVGAAERLLRRGPTRDVEVVRLRARALGRLGRRRAAVRLLASAAFENPQESELHLDTAAALLAAGRDASAERCLLRALSHHPEDAQIWAALAELAWEQGRVGLAYARVRAALRRHRRSAAALGLLVRIHLLRGSPLRARHAGRAALRVVPPDDPVVCAPGRALLACGAPGPALVVLRRYVRAAPDDPAGYLAMSEAFVALGDLDSASRQRDLAGLVSQVV